MRNCLILLAFTTSPGSAWALPTIGTYSGTFDNGATVTVLGGGFGSDVSTDRIFFLKDAIEAGEDDDIPGWPAEWRGDPDGAYTTAARIDTGERWSGSKSIRCDFVGSSYDSGFQLSFPSGIQQSYVTSWIKFNPRQEQHLTAHPSPYDSAPWDGTCGQWKMMSLAASDQGVGSQDFFVTNYHWYRDTGVSRGHCYNNTAGVGYDGGNTNGMDYAHACLQDNVWNRHEGYGERASGAGVADGSYDAHKYRTDGKRFIYGKSGLYTHLTTSSESLWDWVNFGGYWGNLKPYRSDTNQCGPAHLGLPRDASAWWDDTYVSINNGRARVELCSFATWASSAHAGSVCEIQHPTAWSDSSIRITVNTGGGFATGQTAYLYVVDPHGAVNATGKPLTVGASNNGGDTDTEPPYLGQQDPAPGANAVPLDTPVSFRLYDAGEGVAVETIRVRLDGREHTCANGLSCVDQSGGAWGNVLVTCSPSPFAAASTISVSVDAEDRASPANSMPELTWSFTTVAAAAPALRVTSHDNGEMPPTRVVEVVGVASNTDVVQWQCPQCQPSSGTATGTDTWSFTVTLPTSGYGDEAVTNGTFATEEAWTVGPGWTIADGVASNDGTSDNGSLQQGIFLESYSHRRLCYDVVSHTSGDLFVSQWGYVGSGNSLQLDTSEGRHCYDLIAVDASGSLRLVAVHFRGSIDNVSDRRRGARAEVTVTATGSGNSTSTALILNFFGETDSPVDGGDPLSDGASDDDRDGGDPSHRHPSDGGGVQPRPVEVWASGCRTVAGGAPALGLVVFILIARRRLRR